MREVVVCRELMTALLAMSADEARRCLLALYEWQRTGVAEPPRLEGARIVFEALLASAQSIEDERLAKEARAEESKERKRERDREAIKERRAAAKCRQVSPSVADDKGRQGTTRTDKERKEEEEEKKERNKERIEEEEGKKGRTPPTPQGEAVARPLVSAKFVIDEQHRPDWLRADLFPAFLGWLEYKRSRRESYGGEIGAKRAYHRLVNLSLGDPAAAQQIVEYCVAQGYKGLFAPKELQNRQGGGVGRRLPTNQEIANGISQNLGRY